MVKRLRFSRRKNIPKIFSTKNTYYFYRLYFLPVQIHRQKLKTKNVYRYFDFEISSVEFIFISSDAFLNDSFFLKVIEHWIVVIGNFFSSLTITIFQNHKLHFSRIFCFCFGSIEIAVACSF